MKNQIQSAIQASILTLKNQGVLPSDLSARVEVTRARDKKHGDYASNIAMILAKPAGLTPRELAEAIIANLSAEDGITDVNIAGPGFINFFVSENIRTACLTEILSKADGYGSSSLGEHKHVHIEYVSANPTGPLHVGHGRSAAYGASLSNILVATGHSVHREYYVNDAGRQMNILAISTWLRYLELLGETINLPSKVYQGDYVIDIARQLMDLHGESLRHTMPAGFDEPQLFEGPDAEQQLDAMIASARRLLGEENFQYIKQTSLNAILTDIKDDLFDFGVDYDNWFSENSLIKDGLLEQGIEALKKGGFVYEQSGALWFKATAFDDEKDRVLVRQNGQPTYFASDVAYHLHKYNAGYTDIIDIFGADHHGYIPRIKAFLRGLGKNPDQLKIPLVQFAILYRGEEKVSMSTRSGQFVTLRQLREEVGNDAARYFYIMRKPDQHLDFDLELATSKSNENPVYYIQYAHARIASIWKQLAQKDQHWDEADGLAHANLLSSPAEIDLLNQLANYPDTLTNAAKQYAPHTLCNYLHRLASLFHSYYNNTRCLVDDAHCRNARLCLLKATQQVIFNALTLLGITAPNEM